jgi:hypothetical protein
VLTVDEALVDADAMPCCVELIMDEVTAVEPVDEGTPGVDLLVLVDMLVEMLVDMLVGILVDVLVETLVNTLVDTLVDMLLEELVDELRRETLDDVVDELETPLLPALEILSDEEALEVDVFSTGLLEAPVELPDEALEAVLELIPDGEDTGVDEEVLKPLEPGTRDVLDVRLGGTTAVLVAVVVIDVVVLELLNGSSGARSAAIVTVVQP